MDISNTDTVTDLSTRTMFQLRLIFADGTILSPSEVFQQVKDMVKKNNREVRNSVGRVGDLLVGSHYSPGASYFFTMGWYLRKAIEKLEEGNKEKPGMGKCKIQYESEEVSKDTLAQYMGNLLKREAKKIEEMGDEMLRGNLPDDLFGDGEESGTEG